MVENENNLKIDDYCKMQKLMNLVKIAARQFKDALLILEQKLEHLEKYIVKIHKRVQILKNRGENKILN